MMNCEIGDIVLGSVTPEQLDSFWDAYESYLNEIESAENL